MAALDFLFDPWMMQQPGQQPPFGGLPGYPPQLPTAPMFPPTPPRVPIGQGDASLNSETDPANSIQRALASLRPQVPSFPPTEAAPSMPAMGLPPNAPEWATGGMLKPTGQQPEPLAAKVAAALPGYMGGMYDRSGAKIMIDSAKGLFSKPDQFPAPPPPARAAPPLAGEPVQTEFNGFTAPGMPERTPIGGTPAPAAEPAAAPSAPAPAPSASPGAQPPSWLQSAAQPRFQQETPHPGVGGAPKVETIGPENPPVMPSAPSAGGGILGWLGQNRNMLAMMGAGIAGGKNTGDAVSGALQGSVHGRQMDVADASRNMTEQALITKGLDPQMAKVAASNPEVLKAILPAIFNKSSFKPLSTEQKTQLGLSPNLPWFMGNDGRPTLPEGIDKVAGHFGVISKDDYGNEHYGFSNPYDKSVAPYTPSGAAAAQPPGTGGPIQTQLDRIKAEGGNVKTARDELTKMSVGQPIPDTAAGKIGIMRPFMQDYPQLRESIAKGGVSGPVDWSMAKAGYGEQGETYRKIQSGTDALRRILTGAGMPAQEAQEYVDRYLPRWRDTTQVALSKVDQLNRELTSMNETLMQGRTLDPSYIGVKPSGPAGGGGYKVLGVR